jgi:hypothetical protein
MSIAEEFDISREAAARRFVELHPDDLAVVFCKDSRFVYATCGREFPHLSLFKGAQCDLGEPVQGTMSDFDDVAPDDWLHAPRTACELSAQTLWQANGYSITLLRADQSDDDGLTPSRSQDEGGFGKFPEQGAYRSGRRIAESLVR